MRGAGLVGLMALLEACRLGNFGRTPAAYVSTSMPTDTPRGLPSLTPTATPVPMSIQAIIAPPNRNPANAEQPSSYPSSGAGGAPTSGGGTYGSMGRGTPPPTSAPQTAGSEPPAAPAGTPAQPRITGNTQGVVGIPDLKLSAAPDPAQGSLLSSEKNNVKLDDGTFLLLRVNQ